MLATCNTFDIYIRIYAPFISKFCKIIERLVWAPRESPTIALSRSRSHLLSPSRQSSRAIRNLRKYFENPLADIEIS